MIVPYLVVKYRIANTKTNDKTGQVRWQSQRYKLKNTKTCKIQNSKQQKQNTKIQKYKNTKIQIYKIQEYKNIEIQKYKNIICKMQRWDLSSAMAVNVKVER